MCSKAASDQGLEMWTGESPMAAGMLVSSFRKNTDLEARGEFRGWIWSNYHMIQHLSRRIRNRIWETHAHPRALQHYPHSHVVEGTQMSTSRWMDKENMVHTTYMQENIIPPLKRRKFWYKCPRGWTWRTHYAEWSTPVTETQQYCVIPLTWSNKSSQT